jgi:hypothetical protein
VVTKPLVHVCTEIADFGKSQVIGTTLVCATKKHSARQRSHHYGAHFNHLSSEKKLVLIVYMCNLYNLLSFDEVEIACATA